VLSMRKVLVLPNPSHSIKSCRITVFKRCFGKKRLSERQSRKQRRKQCKNSAENSADPRRCWCSFQEIPADFKISSLSFLKLDLNNSLLCRIAARL
jgi:hypothetical protein